MSLEQFARALGGWWATLLVALLFGVWIYILHLVHQGFKYSRLQMRRARIRREYQEMEKAQ